MAYILILCISFCDAYFMEMRQSMKELCKATGRLSALIRSALFYVYLYSEAEFQCFIFLVQVFFLIYVVGLRLFVVDQYRIRFPHNYKSKKVPPPPPQKKNQHSLQLV
jgi:hypothetical protein